MIGEPDPLNPGDEDTDVDNPVDALSEAELNGLRTLIDRRRKGPFLDMEEFEAEILAMLQRKRKARGL